MASTELTVQDWSLLLNDGLKFRNQWGIEKSWGELEALLYNVSKSSANSGPNIILSTLDGLSSQLNVPDPYITVKARNSLSIAKARVVESVDNLLINLIDMPTQVDRMTTAAYLWGTAILKIGYDSEFGWDEATDLGLHGPTGLSMSMYDKSGNRIEYNRFRPGMPWAKMVLPHDFVVPWGTVDIDSAPWCMHRVVRHIDAIRGDAKYNRKVANSLQPNMSMQDFVNSYKSQLKPYRMGTASSPDMGNREGEAEYCELWEIRDRRTQRVMVMATGSDQWLRNDDDLLQITGLPFVSLSFTQKTRSFWCTSDAYYLQVHQAELTDIAIQTTKHRRINILKLMVQRGMIKKEEMDRLMSADVGAIVQTEVPPADITQALNLQNPNLQLYNDSDRVRSNAREQVGFSQNQIGQYQGGRQTATEVNAVAQASGLRLDRRQNMIGRVYTDAIRVINPICFEYWKMPRIVDIMGPDGAPVWQSVTGDDLKGEYNYNVGFSTGGNNDTIQQRRANALQMLPMLLQLGATPASAVNWLKNAMNDPEFSAMFQGQANGQQTQPGQGLALPQNPFQASPGGQQALPMGGSQGGGQGLSALGGI